MERSTRDYLSRHLLFHSTDLDETRTIMGAHWADHQVVITEGNSFATTVNHAALGPARLTYVRCATGLEVSSSSAHDSYIVYLMKSGLAEHVLNGHPTMAKDNVAVVHAPGHQVCMTTTAARCLAIDFPRELVELGFTSRNYSLSDFHRLGYTIDLDAPSGSAFRRLMDWTACELNRVGSTLASTNASDSLAQALLHLFLDSIGTRIPSRAFRDGRLGHIRFSDLESWIQANLEMPLTVERLAEFAGVSTCSVQTAFRRYRDCSPMQFICRVRLEAVRRCLQSPKVGDSVTQIALNYGFFHLGRFSKNYREQFGERPNETLRRALGRLPDDYFPRVE